MKRKHYSSLKESLLLFYDLTFESLPEILYNHLNDLYGYNEYKNINVKWKKNRIRNYKYDLEKAKRKYTNILTEGNRIIGDYLFYTYLYFPRCLQIHITFITTIKTLKKSIY